jgi:hypothetical protein
MSETNEAEGWKEAAIAWELCAAIHREFAKGKDPLFTTKQADYLLHAKTARSKYYEFANITD